MEPRRRRNARIGKARKGLVSGADQNSCRKKRAKRGAATTETRPRKRQRTAALHDAAASAYAPRANERRDRRTAYPRPPGSYERERVVPFRRSCERQRVVGRRRPPHPRKRQRTAALHNADASTCAPRANERRDRRTAYPQPPGGYECERVIPFRRSCERQRVVARHSCQFSCTVAPLGLR
jgi:hypothetical protein